tara:strand:- start:712 stop:849 length:138 start_codon:yes stop_codon:yes gene_type:complete
VPENSPFFLTRILMAIPATQIESSIIDINIISIIIFILFELLQLD